MNKQTYGHIMMDLETFGTKPNCVILSIGAVEFDPATGFTGEVFKVNVEIQDQLYWKREIDAETLKWWLSKPREVLESNFTETRKLLSMLANFKAWLQNRSVPIGELQIWSNGISFDLAIMRNAYLEFEPSYPWHHRNERDVRTMVMLVPEIMQAQEDIGTAHDAVSDCLYQVAYVSKIYQKVKKATV